MIKRGFLFKNMTELITKETITSLEVAEITGKRHDHLLRDIKKMEESWTSIGQPKFGESVYTNSQNKKQPLYNLSKTECLYIATKFNEEARGKLVVRWEYLEKENLNRLKEQQSKSAQREHARLGAPEMTLALKESRELEGKETKHFHYSNEFQLIYLIVFGKKKKAVLEQKGLDNDVNLRDHLTTKEIEVVTKLQKINTSLIDTGDTYKVRKEKLKNVFNIKYKAKLLEELHLLEG